jgi:HPt (histidine-containing phosphotransfer) domain-containing protein
MTTDSHDEAYRELQREYLEELPTALADLRRNVESFRRGENVVPTLKTGLHRLAGSGGSYGFPEISEIARAAEQLAASSSASAGADQLEEALRRLEAVLTAARAQVAEGR